MIIWKKHGGGSSSYFTVVYWIIAHPISRVLRNNIFASQAFVIRPSHKPLAHAHQIYPV